MKPQHSGPCLLASLLIGIVSIPCFSVRGQEAKPEIVAAPEGARVIRVRLVAMEQMFTHNRLGASLKGQMYALERDVLPADHPFDENENDDASVPVDPEKFTAGNVRLCSYKRPRPVVLRANQGDVLEVHLRNLIPETFANDLSFPPGTKPAAEALVKAALRNVTLQVFGLQWLESDNDKIIKPGESHVYRFYAANEGVFMLMSPNGQSIPNSHNDYGLFGSVNVQPEGAEWYRSQVTRDDLIFATYRVNDQFGRFQWKNLRETGSRKYLDGSRFGLPEGLDIREKQEPEAEGEAAPLDDPEDEQRLFNLRFTDSSAEYTPKVSEVEIDEDNYLKAKSGQRLVNYDAVYPAGHPRAGTPILRMIDQLDENVFELVHSDLTALITGPSADRFPFYLNSPSFRENPASPDRRQPYREFTIIYHISPNSDQAFAPFQRSDDPLYYTLQAGKDGFAINYGIAGIGPEIYANRIDVGPQGINKDGVDLKFEEFFLSAWAVGDPAMITNIPANNPNGTRATKALYPDDPSNVYHSYMRDHVKFRVLNAGSVAPHVHHQHAHQWLHTPDSDQGHYLDSQMINPGSTYTMEMTYNGSGNRNQTVGDSIFHCHFYPHFAQGMWSMWRVHDVFEEGTELDRLGQPLEGARALPDGEIVLGTPIPALVPLPTIGMAPMPAKVQLVDGGRRVEVIPEGVDDDGEPLLKNPGFPFFVPGIAGHRAPHPPMDFAWRENENGDPILITEETAGPFHDVGKSDFLDGGLPRHIVTGGEVFREFHSRWDFSKDFAINDENGEFVKGNLEAYELPNEGTAAEQAAMRAHATRTHATSQPNGLPGNFILNGLPPAPGAPYASPDVDDNGNSNFDARRYKAAVIQTDVVFNKQGWHYPQQRFITLLDDVKGTINGDRPPEPFFFRANTGDTIEFWHTNLVPAYYELDDFQVRTPTDILGQHIHLVKFDVTASDGAGNGFNYEDGTFSPDEVRDRINAINANGGLYHFDEKTQSAGARQSELKISSYKEDYGDRLGNPPPGQDWNGAQTTVQRFDTDSLLDNEGEDRTVRTVFTHDHFGPSTHQQVGLYGALLVEPSGSTWIDSLTGTPFPNPENRRDDGGPTSWQALIETQDSEKSFREFAIAVADLQLSYQRSSISSPARPEAVWFSTKNENYTQFLDEGEMPEGLRKVFGAQGAVLSDNLVIEDENPWIVIDADVNLYTIDVAENGVDLDVRTRTIAPGWSDPEKAIWPPQNTAKNAPDAPTPTIISDPGGNGNIGGWVANYRNEPLDQRVQTGDVAMSPEDLARATDPSFAYSSIIRTQKALNSQPAPGAPIADGSAFHYPKTPLLPRGENGMQPTDPYTPLLRAYANDKVEVRAIVGAVDSVHTFRIQGNRWYAEPSFPNSGYRDVQGFAISEHFELNFDLPPADAGSGAPFADYLYAPSTSTQGLYKGTWGIMRAYKDEQEELAMLSSNPVGEGNRAKGFYKPPAGVKPRSFEVSVAVSADGKSLEYQVNGSKASTLVLRANAGDWIEITVNNTLPASLPAHFESAANSSGNNSSAGVKPFLTSSLAGLHAMLLSYDTARASGMNVGFNEVQTVEPGATSKPFYWYAGDIALGANGERELTPIEFGGINLLPSDPLLQQSFGLFGVLVIEPRGATWSKEDAHELTATINDAGGNPLFQEVVLAGNASPKRPLNLTAKAGSEVRFRVLNSANASPGNTSDATNVITIEGHDWEEEPFQENSAIIGHNPLSESMGTQQVTSLETYNLVLPSAGGDNRQPGKYRFFYYPKGQPLGTLTVTAP